jgi:hypothetical protein
MEIAIKRTKEEPRPLENALPGADARSCAIVKKLLNVEAGQRYQSATDLIRDLDAILTGPKPAPSKGPETTKKVENVLATAKSKRRIRMLIHWDLMVTAVALAFFSGGLASRGGAFLERWASQDADLSKRIGLLIGAAIAGGLGIFIYRREFSSIPRKIVLVLLVALMILGGLLAGAWIDRNEGSTAGATIANTAHALTRAALAPVNRLVLGLVVIFAAIQLSWEREPGAYRVHFARLLMLIGFPLIYSFGTAGLGLDAPLRHFMAFPELAIPLVTATILACFFGTLLVTGYNFEGQAKGFGAALAFAGCAGLFAFAVLVSQPTREPWTALLAEPFNGLSRPFRDSATLLGVVLAVAVVERAVVFSGMRLQERSYRKRF